MTGYREYLNVTYFIPQNSVMFVFPRMMIPFSINCKPSAQFTHRSRALTLSTTSEFPYGRESKSAQDPALVAMPSEISVAKTSLQQFSTAFNNSDLKGVL